MWELGTLNFPHFLGKEHRVHCIFVPIGGIMTRIARIEP